MRLSGLLVLAALTLSACGSAAFRPGGPSASSETEVVGAGMVMQSSPELCMGAVMTSYPPQCGGPSLAGEFSWDDVGAETQGGVRWTNGTYSGVGHHDKDSDTFTLTRPLSENPPEGMVLPEPEDVAFPQLCDDPFRGGDPRFTDPDLTRQPALQSRLQNLDGYVGSYVSDGVSMFNVLVTGDPEVAHAELREVWRGGLCVEQRQDAPEVDLLAAQQALTTIHEELGVLSSGPDGMTGRLDIQILVADESTVQRIHKTVSPWLTPEQVQITSSFQPLSR